MKPQITLDLFRALDTASRDALEIDAAEKELAKRKDANRAALLQLLGKLKDAGVPDDELNKAVPGVILSTKVKVDLDIDAVLAWALQDDNLPAATPVLQVDKKHVGTVIAAALTDPKWRGVLSVDKAGAEAAAREKLFVGMPVNGMEPQRIVSVTAKNLKHGQALAECFTITDSALMQAARATATERPDGWHVVFISTTGDAVVIEALDATDATTLAESNATLIGRALACVLIHNGQIVGEHVAQPRGEGSPF